MIGNLGILRELEFAQGYKCYELKTPSPHYHHHLVCIQCHKILESQNDLILKQASKQVGEAGLKILDGIYNLSGGFTFGMARFNFK
ncbi:MAG: transcriptional repressor [Scytonematopsis contorta HA4267-MV1]|nr:transcriptional repressor [Scytonematopsis contorta HA4267-MV1]